MKKAIWGLSAFLLANVAVTVNAQTISNSPNGAVISPFGSPDSLTYGEVFTAPITGYLTSFSLTLNGGVGSVFGGVGDWNGGSSYNVNFGSPTNLYQSPDVASNSAGPVTFSPNIAVIAGQQYVAYLSAFGTSANASTEMPLGNAAAGLDYFVWNNTSDPRNNPSWNYFFNSGNALFSASFSTTAPVPETATWAMMIGGLGLIGAHVRRKKVGVSLA